MGTGVALAGGGWVWWGSGAAGQGADVRFGSFGLLSPSANPGSPGRGHAGTARRRTGSAETPSSAHRRRRLHRGCRPAGLLHPARAAQPQPHVGPSGLVRRWVGHSGDQQAASPSQQSLRGFQTSCPDLGVWNPSRKLEHKRREALSAPAPNRSEAGVLGGNRALEAPRAVRAGPGVQVASHTKFAHTCPLPGFAQPEV